MGIMHCIGCEVGYLYFLLKIGVDFLGTFLYCVKVSEKRDDALNKVSFIAC